MEKKVKELYEKLNGEYERETIQWIRKTRPKIYTILRHVSNSGMLRVIDVYAIRNNQRIWLTPLVGKLTGYPRDKKRDGLRVGGCGMDMGFSIVYSFSRYVFPTGFYYKKNEWHRNNDPSKKDSDGGYALKQEWI